MSIKSFNGLYNTHAQEMERLRQQQATAPPRAMPGTSDDTRNVIDRLDLLSLHGQYLDRLDAEAVSCRPQCVKLGVGSTLATVAGGALLLSHVTSSAAATIALASIPLLAAACAVAGVATWFSTRSAQQWTAAQRAEHRTERASLEAQLQSQRAQGRTDGEQRVRDAAQKSSVGMVLVDQTQKDPAVAVAAQRLDNAERAAAARASLLLADRKTLFASEPSRVDRLWKAQAEDCASSVNLAVSLGALTVGGLSGVLFGMEAGVIAGFAVAASGIVGGRALMKRQVPTCVEREIRRELRDEMTRERSQLEALRASMTAARDEASSRYVEIADEAAANVQPSDAAPTVSVGDGHVTIGALKLPRRA